MGATKNLVLGGSGTIGAALCRRLQQQGEQVVNLDLKEGFDLRTMDLSDYADTDYVWFLAWEVGGAKYLGNPARQQEILLSNTLLCAHVFSFLQKTKLPFLFTSSQLVSAETAYGITKLLGEQLAASLGGAVVRFWNVYGWEEPGEKSHVITDMVLQALTTGTIRLMTTGEEERQFIYIDDCTKHLLAIRDSGETRPQHLTNGQWMKINDLAHHVAGVIPATVLTGKANGYQNKIDPDTSCRRFTWETGLQEGIRRVADEAREYLKHHPDAVRTS
jgi:nucleoside-diphosphate-sugar epimerase